VTTPVAKDSFGVEVNVGDYLVYATKTRYLNGLGIGRVVKISPTGSLSMLAIITNGKTVAEEQANRETNWNRVVAEHAARGETITKGSWLYGYYNPDAMVFKQRLGDASSTYKVPAYAVPVDISQALSRADS
jgi:hypothetical protein